MNIIYLQSDLSNEQATELLNTTDIAVDTELTGLDVHSDKLCLVQLRARDSDNFYLVQVFENKDYPNLARVLSAPNVVKIFHYARMDLLMIYKRLGIWAMPVFCTKIGILLARPRKGHTLQNALREIFKIDLEKDECCSNWTKKLTSKQQKYAANDVMYLHMLKDYLTDQLNDKNRLDVAKKCYDFLPTRCMLDMDWGERDVFGYNPK